MQNTYLIKCYEKYVLNIWLRNKHPTWKKSHETFTHGVPEVVSVSFCWVRLHNKWAQNAQGPQLSFLAQAPGGWVSTLWIFTAQDPGWVNQSLFRTPILLVEELEQESWYEEAGGGWGDTAQTTHTWSGQRLCEEGADHTWGHKLPQT